MQPPMAGEVRPRSHERSTQTAGAVKSIVGHQAGRSLDSASHPDGGLGGVCRIIMQRDAAGQEVRFAEFILTQSSSSGNARVVN